MSDEPRFAEQYSRSERVRFVVLMLIGGTIVIAAKAWFVPWLRQFSASAHCHDVLGINGAVFLMYALFIGLPLFAAVPIACVCIPLGFKTLRDGQYPPIGQKVMRPARIRTGNVARLYGYANFLPVACLLALAVWGAFQARDIVSTFNPTHIDRNACAAAHPSHMVSPKAAN